MLIDWYSFSRRHVHACTQAHEITRHFINISCCKWLKSRIVQSMASEATAKMLCSAEDGLGGEGQRFWKMWAHFSPPMGNSVLLCLFLPRVHLPAAVTGTSNGSSCSSLGILWLYPVLGQDPQRAVLIPVPKFSVCARALQALCSTAMGQYGHSKTQLLASLRHSISCLAQGHCGES